LVADLVGRKVDVIATNGTLDEKRNLDDPDRLHHRHRPVGDRLVASLARPGGSLTGVGMIGTELAPKRLELLTQLVPQAGVIALLVNSNYPNAERIVRDV
jgi:putative ABC transport system substrate-binding protein